MFVDIIRRYREQPTTATPSKDKEGPCVSSSGHREIVHKDYVNQTNKSKRSLHCPQCTSLGGNLWAHQTRMSSFLIGSLSKPSCLIELLSPLC